MPKKVDRKFVALDSISPHLFCAICQDVFYRPTRASCGHSFCWNCINKWSYQNKSCPHCRKFIKQKKLKPDLIPMKIIDDLEVACSAEECKWKGRLEVLGQHLKNCEIYAKQKNTPPSWLCPSEKNSIEIIEIVDEPLVISDSENNVCYFYDEVITKDMMIREVQSREENRDPNTWESYRMNSNNYFGVDTSSLRSSADSESSLESMDLFELKNHKYSTPHVSSTKPNTRLREKKNEKNSRNKKIPAENTSLISEQAMEVPESKSKTKFPRIPLSSILEGAKTRKKVKREKDAGGGRINNEAFLE